MGWEREGKGEEGEEEGGEKEERRGRKGEGEESREEGEKLGNIALDQLLKKLEKYPRAPNFLSLLVGIYTNLVCPICGQIL